MPFDFDVSKIKLTGGLVGRVCWVLLVGCAAFGAIGVASKNEYIMGGAIIAIIVFAFPILWRIIRFAERNPAVAILDGAQFLKHQQLLMASKTERVIEVVPDAQIQERPATLLPEQAAAIDEPEVIATLPQQGPVQGGQNRG